MASFSATDPDLLGSLNDKHGKLLQMLAKAKDAKQAHQTLGKEANAAGSCPQLEYRQAVAPGLLVRDGLTLPLGLAPPGEFTTPKGLAGPNHSMAEKCGMTAVPGSDDHGEADAMGTSVETGDITGFGTSDCKELRPKANEFQMKADAPAFVPGMPMPLVLCCFGPNDELPSETTCRPKNQRNSCKPKVTEFQMRVAEAKKTLEALDMPAPRNQRRLVHTAEAAAAAAKKMETTMASPFATDPDPPRALNPGVPTNHNKIPPSIKEADDKKRSDLSMFFAIHPDFPSSVNQSAPTNLKETPQTVEEANDGETSSPSDPLFPIKSEQQTGDEKVPQIVQVEDAEMPQTVEEADDGKMSSPSDPLSPIESQQQTGDEKVPRSVQVVDANTRTAMAAFPWSESKAQSRLLGALNLSMPTNQRKLRRILAKAADSRNKSQTHGKAADAAVFATLLDPRAPPGLARPGGDTPADDLVPSAGLAKADAAALPADAAVFSTLLDPGAPPGLSRSDGVTPPQDCAPPAGLAKADAVDLPPPPGLEVPPGLSLPDEFTTPNDLSPPPGLEAPPGLSLPGPPKGLLATATDAKKASQNLDTAPDAAVPSSSLGLEAPPGLSESDRITPPKDLAQPAGLAGPNCSEVGKSQKKAVSGSDDYVESDAKGTNDGTDSMTGCGSSDCEEPEPEVEGQEFQEKADAPCFVALASETTCATQKPTLQTLLGKGAGFFAPICVLVVFFTLLFGIVLPEDVTGKVLPAGLVPVLELMVPVLEVIVPVLVVGNMVWRGVWSGQNQAGERSPKCA